MSKVRIVIAALSFSAAGLASLVDREYFTAGAVRPTPLDVPTYGFGSTVKADGTPVRMGDTITPPKAVRLAVQHIEGDERTVKACAAGVELTQAEWDLYIKFVYNIGAPAFCSSTMLKRLKVRDYVGACEQFKAWRMHKGFDCSTPGNKICGGLWSDRLASREACLKEALS